MTGLTDSVALVTGGGRGIGRALAIGLADRGARVAVCARGREQVDETAARIDAAGGSAFAAVADVTDPAQVHAMVAAVETALGPVDALVNNAGRIDADEVPIWRADPDDWWQVVEASVRGPFLVSRAVLPGMIERRRGRVVNINTGTSLRDPEIYSAYSVGKTALMRLTGAIAVAGSEHGVYAFDVAPGVVDTAMTRSMPIHRDRTEWTDPDAVAKLIARLVAGEGDALTGRYLRVGSDDDLESLANIVRNQPEARRLRLRPYGQDDPLG